MAFNDPWPAVGAVALGAVVGLLMTLGLTVLAVLLAVSTAFGAQPCDYIPRPPLVALKTAADESLGLVFETFDQNGDGTADYERASTIKRHDEADPDAFWVAHAPLFHWIDLDLDGTPDLMLVDTDGTGTCDSIRLYEDNRIPHHTPDTNTRRRGFISDTMEDLNG